MSGIRRRSQLVFDLAPEYFWSPDIAVHKTIFLSDYGKAEQIETPAYTSHKIRAPGL